MSRLLLKLCEFVQCDNAGCGWKIQKYLDLQHLACDIHEFGPASGFNASQEERGLKLWAKFHALTAQKHSQDCFEEQVCLRIMDLSMLSTLTNDTSLSSYECVANLSSGDAS